MMSATSYTSGLYRLKIWSKPALRMPLRRRMNRMVITGSSDGTVMAVACRSRPAPSIRATSYMVGSMDEIAAR